MGKMITRRQAIAKENKLHLQEMKSYKEKIRRIDRFFNFVERHPEKNNDLMVSYKTFQIHIFSQKKQKWQSLFK